MQRGHLLGLAALFARAGLADHEAHPPHRPAQADQGGAAESQADAGAKSAETNDEDVEDVDFEEVK